MNYNKIYTSLIERARGRSDRDGVYHKHHIIPIHEDGNSTETVLLTVKEHAFAHRLRYAMTKTVGNYIAWRSLSGRMRDEELFRALSSLGGRIGGAMTKELKSGIFSDDWDRSSETKRRWESGVLNFDIVQQLLESGHYSRAGSRTKELKSGIFSDDWDRSLESKRRWSNMSSEERAIRVEMNRVNSVLGGKRSKELGTNFSSMSAEEQLKIASLGGAATAKKYTGTKVWNNGVRNCRAFESPGPEWTLGMINVKKDKL